MPSFAIRKVEPSAVSGPELDHIGSVLTKAFTGGATSSVVANADIDEFSAGHDPGAPVTDPSHITALWVSTVRAGLLGGEVYVAETKDADKKIVGCAVWFGPGDALFDTPEQQQQALGPLTHANLQKWWGEEFLPQYYRFVDCALGAGVKHKSWHLQTLGVDPEYQRQGVATRLVNAIVEKARPSGTPLCLEVETELNLKIYSRMGFELMPRGKGGKDDCFDCYTGVNGKTFKMWVMERRSE
ncbi:hypothetical protein GGX14DRAFT_32079 [Mycena pura]|uniref:N-acetyltransferase domain-containing protein n=1 Tax=Mycena pura TaxID=153505 RepID=A0AAD6UPM3_9AGAR|nr:hypothetical protein GGX14DRAFT_32079 [Mycena pura]